MRLNDYLSANCITKTEFAARTGTTLATISRIADGSVMPRRELLEKIYRETEGLVSPNDLTGLHYGGEGCLCSTNNAEDSS